MPRLIATPCCRVGLPICCAAADNAVTSRALVRNSSFADSLRCVMAGRFPPPKYHPRDLRAAARAVFVALGRLRSDDLVQLVRVGHALSPDQHALRDPAAG